MGAPTIETERLVLRPWRADDIEAWAELCADERVMEFFPSVLERDAGRAQAQRLRDRLDADGYGWWVAERKGGPAMAGVIALQAVPFEAPFTPALEVGWRLRVDQWGQGLASEGGHAALRFAFERLGVAEVVAMTARLNRRSQRVMERLGMTRDPADDFDHPWIADGDRLRPHVLYRRAAGAAGRPAMNHANAAAIDAMRLDTPAGAAGCVSEG